ncbi:16S rRNA (guanine(527)-N(7))-methyltransferase RsmG [Candidatus Poriferisocius sp.]|uniref:16S rRNA (guanine(527)-N(7))-methyltransferase RsmG n=1 Tax=Candidatus Poriferisocius sp. TaxID=3101276 RepID=UPI003B59174D
MDLPEAERSRLSEVFRQAQERGWIGRQAVDQHIHHALGFAAVAAGPPGLAVDVGSGGGLPALVLAAVWPQSEWVLTESSLPRAAFLELQCARLGWSERVRVHHGPAQSLGGQAQFRARVDLVTARGFGSPEVIVELASQLLRVGGELVVSAAPNAVPWPPDQLRTHSMTADRLTPSSPRFHRSTRLCFT